ncbi:response regulator transcription factor [Ramlibacter henchirensis]|uniref:response regulator transcription factor n=1 Tax=Ramlibacter henchirensis TaxID=204072 RepID=UPI00197E5520|nr:response regulator [Ramlibacter henchirensis]
MPQSALVAIVDDDPSIRDTTQDLLASAGLDAETFVSAQQLLDSGHLDRVACVVADMRMPGMSGLALHEHVAASGGSVSTILITAYPDEATRRRALKAGVIAYLTKPFAGDELLDCIGLAAQRSPSVAIEGRFPPPHGRRDGEPGSPTLPSEECSMPSPCEVDGAEQLRAVHTTLAAATAVLPITPEMAWSVPRLVKRTRLIPPGPQSTTGVLRAVIGTPALDEAFAQALADSGFLSCDKALEQARWKYDIEEMLAKERSGGAGQVLEHCRSVLAQHRTRQPFDWDAVLAELQTLASWFPELRTLHLLEQLYTRLQALHVQAVLAAELWVGRGSARSMGVAHA